MKRAGRVNFIGLLMVLASGVIGAGVWIFGPYYYDAFIMRDITVRAALEWHHSESKQEGKKHLVKLLYSREIPDYIDEKHCGFNEWENIREVSCDWQVDVMIPGTDRYETLEFSVTTEVDQNLNIETF